eukprot:TRINITY_DN7662_c0_g1_i1.p1 TRINITY_DN7662_c0_g1~~TRINITY_DN7662_c0_g1_i1.p1  ORF type:complete len:546 (-),score=96.25 TRINITY_DN7662_c0_g1_i1:484-2121(-)
MPESRRDVVAILGVASAGVAAVYLVRRLSQKRRSGTIPDLKLPRGTYFGLQALYAAGKDSFNYGVGRLMLQGCDPKAGIAKLSIFGQSNVILRDPELVKEVMTKNSQAGGGYGKSFRDSPFDPLIDTTFGRGLFFAEDQDKEWSVAHKILSRPFSHRGVVAMMPTMCEQADNLVAVLRQESKAGATIYIYDFMVKMALETIAVCSMGTSLDCFKSRELPPFPLAFQRVMDAVFDLFAIPAQLWSLCFLTQRRMKRSVREMNKIIDDIVEKRMRDETRSVTKQADLLDVMLRDGSGAKLSAENIRSQILTFLFAGHDSTAAAMSSFIVFMLANPKVEAKVVEEIRQVVGDEELNANHLTKLTYLDWCVKETLRLLPPAGNFQRTAFDEDLMLGGKWRLHRFQPILIDIFTLHMDPETWGPDAAEFVPERWEKGAPHPYSYMPFAAGPRGCIGKEFSLLEQKIVAVKLLQNFEFRTPAAGSWKPRKGSVLIKSSEPMAQPILGIDAEFNPQQFFVGASLPVLLKERQGSVDGLRNESSGTDPSVGGA